MRFRFLSCSDSRNFLRTICPVFAHENTSLSLTAHTFLQDLTINYQCLTGRHSASFFPITLLERSTFAGQLIASNSARRHLTIALVNRTHLPTDRTINLCPDRTCPPSNHSETIATCCLVNAVPLFSRIVNAWVRERYIAVAFSHTEY